MYKVNYLTIIVGTGEIGRPLYELMNGVFKTLPIDQVHFKENLDINAKCGFLHICLPGTIENFDKIVMKYVKSYEPERVIIHSTLVPGATAKLNKKLGKDLVVHAPVHGKHQGNQMKKDMLRYPKYVGVPESLNEKEVEEIKNHFARMGFANVVVLKKPETTEWLKILATTIFGLQVSFAQEVERICDEYDLKYDEITHFFPIQEDARGPIYPGVIGGHCVMPNVKILQQAHKCKLWDWMEKSNEEKKIREGIKLNGCGR